MAQSSLSGKSQLRFSLAMRVLLVCSCLVIIPLLLHTLIVYREDEDLKKERLYVLLDTMGDEHTQWIEDRFSYDFERLKLIGMIEGTPLEELAKSQNLADLFWAKNPPDQKITPICAEIDPISGERLVYLSQEIPGKGVLTMAVKGCELLFRLAHYNFPLYFSVITNDNQIFISEHEGPFSLDEVLIITDKNLEEDWKNLPYVGVRVEIYGAPFELLIDVPHSAVEALPSLPAYLEIAALLLWVLVAIGAGVTAWLTFRMARPLQALSREMEKLGAGRFDVEYVRDPMGFEVNALGRHFNQMVTSLLFHIEQVKVLATELKIGHEIQESLLPKEVPAVSGLDIGAAFMSAKEVGGDFYDLFFRGDNLFFGIADASGKGISACLYSLMLRSMLRSYAAGTVDLSDIIRRSNNLFCFDTGDSGMFVTAWIGSYDVDTRMLHYANRGHLPAILRRKDGSIETLTTPGMAIGVEKFDEVTVSYVQLHPGDCLLLYTDGVIEAHDPNSRLFGMQRLTELVLFMGNKNAQEFVDGIAEKVRQFSQDAPAHDDLTVLAIRVL